MSVKIMGANFDDLAKLMGADLIIAGDAVVGEVKTGVTFYAGSSTLLIGSGTQTLNPANENVPEGFYEVTTLSVVDPDLAPGNIKDGVTIFGKTGTVVPLVISDYHYYEFLSAGASYTPTAHAVSTLAAEDGTIGNNAINVEFFDGGGWVTTVGAVYTTIWVNVYGMQPLNQDHDQSLRIKNDLGSALDINLTGVIFSLTDYHYYANLANNASYTPTAQ